MTVARNYMVDYLENVCLHKYEKIHKKDDLPMRPDPAKEVPTTSPDTEIKPPAMPEPYEVPDVTPPIRAFTPEEPKKEPKKVDKDILIRQILEEFMA